MQQSHISGHFVGSPHDVLRRLLDERVGGRGGPKGAEKENCKVPPIPSASRFLRVGC